MKQILKILRVKYLSKRFGIKNRSAAECLEYIYSADYKNDNLLRMLYNHSKGFTQFYSRGNVQIDADNNKYLSTAKYMSLSPLNGIFDNLINDKLTLYYLFKGKKVEKYIPDYYFYIDPIGTIFEIDKNKGIAKTNEVLEIIAKKKIVAIKLVSGSIGLGFYKAEYKNNKYYFNNKMYTKANAIKLIDSLKNYVVMEYIIQHDDLNKYNPYSTCSIRYLAGRIDSNLEMLEADLKLGTKQTGSINMGNGAIITFIDEKGKYGHESYTHDDDHLYNEPISIHPDSKLEIKGSIPMWNDIKKAVKEIGDTFPMFSYLGFDFVVTKDKKIKLLEINSLPAVYCMRLDDNSNAARFFNERLKNR